MHFKTERCRDWLLTYTKTTVRTGKETKQAWWSKGSAEKMFWLKKIKTLQKMDVNRILT